jgi:two-component system cell cycle response regulator
MAAKKNTSLNSETNTNSMTGSITSTEEISTTGLTEETNSEEKTRLVSNDTFNERRDKFAKSPASMVMIEGPAGYVGKRWPLDQLDIIIGRSMTSTIFVDDKSVSKSHAKITVTNGEVYLLDLESTNSTEVNDDPIPALIPLRLKNNDQIKTGNVLFKFLESGSFEAAAIEQLQNRSEKDPLTGIYNKGALNLKGLESFKRAKLLKVPLSIAVFDIDHFKNINDQYLHTAGDFVLKEIAATVQTKIIRLDDVLARYGGEEFVVLLFGSNLQQGTEIGERLRATIENHKFIYNGIQLPITISVGVATKEVHMNTWEELFARADSAMYAAKRSGRNRVSTGSAT